MAKVIQWPKLGKNGVGLVGMPDGRLVYLWIEHAQAPLPLSCVKSLRTDDATWQDAEPEPECDTEAMFRAMMGGVGVGG